MISIFTSVWENVLEPLLQRPKRQQVAALCYRGVGKGKQVLLVTSRGTGRWIIPKGWPIRGKNGSQSAMQEAWEEAGVREGTTGTAAIGSYTYDKQQSSGWSFPVETMVYPVAVETLEDELYDDIDMLTIERIRYKLSVKSSIMDVRYNKNKGK